MYKIDHLFTKTSFSFPPFHLRSLRFCIKKSCFMKYYVVDSSYTFYSRRGFTPVKLFDPLTCWPLPHPLMIWGPLLSFSCFAFFYTRVIRVFGDTTFHPVTDVRTVTLWFVMFVCPETMATLKGRIPQQTLTERKDYKAFLFRWMIHLVVGSILFRFHSRFFLLHHKGYLTKGQWRAPS